MIKYLKEVLNPNLFQNIHFAKFHSFLQFGILFFGGGEEQGVN